MFKKCRNGLVVKDRLNKGWILVKTKNQNSFLNKKPRGVIPGFSIRYKFLFVTSLLLGFCVCAYLFLASEIFKRDKTELVFDLNRSVVTNTIADLETLFRGVDDKIKLVALLSQQTQEQKDVLISDLFQNDSEIVFMGRSDQFKKLDQIYFSDSTFHQTYNLQEGYLSQSDRDVPFAEIQTAGSAIWKADIPGGTPLIGYGKNVVSTRPDEAVTPFAMIVYLRSDALLKTMTTGSQRQITVANKHGNVLLHSDAEKLSQISEKPILDHPLMTMALQAQSVKVGVAEFRDAEGERWLGAIAHGLGKNLFVVSQVSSKVAFSAVDRLVLRSLNFALVVATLAFLAAIFFSRSLTRPIQSLVKAMNQVADGDLETHIEIKSRDEIFILARSFNDMIKDLRESRDELEEANRDLEAKVLDRTQKLAEQNQTVKRTQEALLQTTRLAAVGEIAGRAAHEVLNPLTSIMTRIERVQGRLKAQTLNEASFLNEIFTSWENDFAKGGFGNLVDAWAAPSSLNPEIKLWDEDMQNIRNVQKTLKTQIQQTLDDTEFLLREGTRINKIVQSMRSLVAVKGNWSDCSVHEVLAECIQIMEDLSRNARISIEADFKATEDHVHMERHEFVQSVTNLLRNSMQAIAQRPDFEDIKGLIRVVTKDTSESLVIDIIDNGIGVAPENQAKLFESQFSTKPNDVGTGLGLSISRRFVRAFGGDIFLLESSAQKQTVFRIKLPIKGEKVIEKSGINTGEAA